MEAITSNDNKVVQPLHRLSVQEGLMDICCPQSQEEIVCPGLTHHAQGLSLTTLSQSSVALNALFHAVFARSSLGITSGTLSAELLHSGYSVRAVVEFGVPDDVGNELLGIC